MADLFQGLFEAQWRSIGAPCRAFKTSGGQDIAEHKRVDRDGARLEGTGRMPYQFDVEWCFINGLAPGPNETWSGDLFPGRLQDFLKNLEDRSSGPLQHPIFGNYTVKPITWDFALSGDERGGVILHAQFKETDDTDDAKSLGSQDAFTNAQVAAIDLDASLSQLDPPPDPSWGLDDDESFSDFVSSIQSIGDGVSLLKNQVTGSIDNVVAKVDRISDAFSNAAPQVTVSQNLTTNTGSVSFATKDNGGLGRSVVSSDGSSRPLGSAGVRIVDACNRLRDSLSQVQATLQTKQKTIGFYTVLRTTTLGALATPLRTSITDLLTLNPGAPAILQAESIVRYYTS